MMPSSGTNSMDCSGVTQPSDCMYTLSSTSQQNSGVFSGSGQISSVFASCGNSHSFTTNSDPFSALSTIKIEDIPYPKDWTSEKIPHGSASSQSNSPSEMDISPCPGSQVNLPIKTAFSKPPPNQNSHPTRCERIETKIQSSNDIAFTESLTYSSRDNQESNGWNNHFLQLGTQCFGAVKAGEKSTPITMSQNRKSISSSSLFKLSTATENMIASLCNSSSPKSNDLINSTEKRFNIDLHDDKNTANSVSLQDKQNNSSTSSSQPLGAMEHTFSSRDASNLGHRHLDWDKSIANGTVATNNQLFNSPSVTNINNGSKLPNLVHMHNSHLSPCYLNSGVCYSNMNHTTSEVKFNFPTNCIKSDRIGFGNIGAGSGLLNQREKNYFPNRSNSECEELHFQKSVIRGCLELESILKSQKTMGYFSDLESFCGLVKKLLSEPEINPNLHTESALKQLAQGFLHCVSSWLSVHAFLGDENYYASNFYQYRTNAPMLLTRFKEWQIKTKDLLEAIIIQLQKLTHGDTKTLPNRCDHRLNKEYANLIGLKEPNVDSISVDSQSLHSQGVCLTSGCQHQNTRALHYPNTKVFSSIHNSNEKSVIKNLRRSGSYPNISMPFCTNDWKHQNYSPWHMGQGDHIPSPQQIEKIHPGLNWTTGTLRSITTPSQACKMFSNINKYPIGGVNPLQHSIELTDSGVQNQIRADDSNTSSFYNSKAKENIYLQSPSIEKSKLEDLSKYQLNFGQAHFSFSKPDEVKIHDGNVYNNMYSSSSHIIPLHYKNASNDKLPQQITKRPFLSNQVENITIPNGGWPMMPNSQVSNIMQTDYNPFSNSMILNPHKFGYSCNTMSRSIPSPFTIFSRGIDVDDSSDELLNGERLYLKPGSYQVPKKNMEYVRPHNTCSQAISSSTLLPNLTPLVVPQPPQNIWYKRASKFTKKRTQRLCIEGKATDSAWVAALASAKPLCQSLKNAENSKALQLLFQPTISTSIHPNTNNMTSENNSARKETNEEGFKNDCINDMSEGSGSKLNTSNVKLIGSSVIKIDDWLIKCFPQVSSKTDNVTELNYKTIGHGNSDSNGTKEEIKDKNKHKEQFLERKRAIYISNQKQHIKPEGCKNSIEFSPKENIQNFEERETHPTNILQRKCTKSAESPARKQKLESPPPSKGFGPIGHRGINKAENKRKITWPNAKNRNSLSRQTTSKLQDIVDSLGKVNICDSTKQSSDSEEASLNGAKSKDISNIDTISYKLKHHMYESFEQADFDIQHLFNNIHKLYLDKEHLNAIGKIEKVYEGIVERHSSHLYSGANHFESNGSFSPYTSSSLTKNHRGKRTPRK